VASNGEPIIRHEIARPWAECSPRTVRHDVQAVIDQHGAFITSGWNLASRFVVPLALGSAPSPASQFQTGHYPDCSRQWTACQGVERLL